jgi:hypothetical protein
MNTFETYQETIIWWSRIMPILRGETDTITSQITRSAALLLNVLQDQKQIEFNDTIDHLMWQSTLGRHCVVLLTIT